MPKRQYALPHHISTAQSAQFAWAFEPLGTSEMKMKDLDLDFSGGQNSWFDFWHTHVDWKGQGNLSWEARLPYLNELIARYNALKSELKHYPKEYHLWILIDEQDSAEDAIYIHTRNPNADNFPLVVDNILPQINNKKLKDFIDSLNMRVVQVDTLEGKLFYVFDENIGIPVTKEKP